MPASNPYRPDRSPWITAGVIASVFCGLIIWCLVGVTSFFRLSSETAALRSSFMRAVPGEWDKKIALNVGWFTTGAVRLGSRLFTLPPEPRAALDALHGAEVGIYRLEHKVAALDAATILKTADRAMKSRGWDRIVGVVDDRELVAVYWPRRVASPGKVKCCVLVFHGRELIVSSVRGNLEPVLELVKTHTAIPELNRRLRRGA